MYILKSSNIYNMESSAKEIFGLTDEILMENAGVAVFKKVLKTAKNNNRIAVLSGPGNNGGDGFVTARHLISHGFSVDVFYTGDDSMYKNAAKTNLNILQKMSANLYPFTSIVTFSNYDIIVDALFGVGLKRKISGVYENIINLVNSSKAIVISIDIPSGLYADTPFVENTTIKADYTITFSCLKYCLCLYPAKKYAGKIKVADITIPKNHIEKYEHDVLVNKKNLPFFKIREKDSHKGTFGRVVSIGGSIDMAGAVKITAFSALKSGCGLVTLLHPNDLDRNFISDIPEIMTKSFDYENPEAVYEYVNSAASSVTLGNGMGQKADTQEFIRNLVLNINKPLVIDADGINAIRLDVILETKNQIIITPHLKEFSRLINKSVEEIIKNKIDIAKEFCNKYKVILVLKSADTVIAIPNEQVYIINEGNTALSKGGSGDALTGLISSFIAQGYSNKDACILACYTLGKSAKYAVKKSHPSSLLITDIIKYYKKVFNE